MDESALRNWLDLYGQAWESQDPVAATAIFTADGTYQWGPFNEPIRGREAIRAAWEYATQGQQKDITFGYEILAVTDAHGIARWWASMTTTSSGVAVRMEGIFVIVLDDKGLCRSFREWWNEDPPATGASAYE